MSSEYEVEGIDFVSMTTQNTRKDFVDEMITKTVIHTACTQIVAGELWLQNYMKNLDDTSLNQVEISESHKILKFGDGCKVIATSKQNYQHKLAILNALLQLKFKRRFHFYYVKHN